MKFTKQQIRWFANQAIGGFTDLPTVPAAAEVWKQQPRSFGFYGSTQQNAQ